MVHPDILRAATWPDWRTIANACPFGASHVANLAASGAPPDDIRRACRDLAERAATLRAVVGG